MKPPINRPRNLTRIEARAMFAALRAFVASLTFAADVAYTTRRANAPIVDAATEAGKWTEVRA